MTSPASNPSLLAVQIGNAPAKSSSASPSSAAAGKPFSSVLSSALGAAPANNAAHAPAAPPATEASAAPAVEPGTATEPMPPASSVLECDDTDQESNAPETDPSPEPAVTSLLFGTPLAATPTAPAAASSAPTPAEQGGVLATTLSTRDRALAAAALAANPRAREASGKTPGPNEHALDSVLKPKREPVLSCEAPPPPSGQGHGQSARAGALAAALLAADPKAQAAVGRALGPNDQALNALLKQAEGAITPSDAPNRPATEPAADSARATALAAAGLAANPKALEAAGKTLGPNAHAIEALLKHAAPSPDGAATGTAPALFSVQQPTELSADSALPANTPTDPSPGASPDTRSAEFPEEIGAKLTWLAERRIGHAQIRVAPPELGAVDIRLHVDGHRVKVDFNSPHAEVRAALEASLPKLREWFDAQGMTLVQADVGGRQGARGESSAATAIRSDWLLTDDGEPTADGTAPPPTLRQQRGLLDEYA